MGIGAGSLAGLAQAAVKCCRTRSWVQMCDRQTGPHRGTDVRGFNLLSVSILMTYYLRCWRSRRILL